MPVPTWMKAGLDSGLWYHCQETIFSPDHYSTRRIAKLAFIPINACTEKIKNPDEKKIRFFSEAGKHSLGEENQKQEQLLPSKFTPLGESIQFAEVQTQEKIRNQNPTSAILSLISTGLKNSREQQRNPRCLKQFYCN